MVDCNEAAAVVTKVVKPNAAQIPRLGKWSVLYTQGNGKPYSATSYPVSMLMEVLPLIRTPLLDLALEHNLFLYTAAGNHYQLIGIAL